MNFSKSIRPFTLATLSAITMTVATPVFAHFQMLIPTDDMVSSPSERHVRMDIKFWDPFEGHGMSMDMPVKFGVHNNGKNIDLRKSLTPHAFQDNTGKERDGYRLTYDIKHPGDYIFYIEPKPYWDAAEEKFIVDCTKVEVDDLGKEQGWDDSVGLKAEIIPLTRPYGLYTNNIFQGMVKDDGKPVPNTQVEVEYYNESGTIKAPDDLMITQIVKTDPNGIFTYAMPRAGWWGFAALTTEKKKMEHDGKKYPVQLGALMWVKAHDMAN